jgi:mRNA interferase MazF
MTMPGPRRGEVWLAELGTGAGHEQQGRRPVLILTTDGYNAGPARLAMICPLTSRIAKSRSIPYHVRVDPPAGGLKVASVVLCDQLRCISQDRLVGSAWGAIDPARLVQVETMLRALLVL